MELLCHAEVSVAWGQGLGSRQLGEHRTFLTLSSQVHGGFLSHMERLRGLHWPESLNWDIYFLGQKDSFRKGLYPVEVQFLIDLQVNVELSK